MSLRFVSVCALICLLAMPHRGEARDPETMGILKGRAENFVQCMLRGSVNSIAGEMHPGLRQTYSNEVVRNIFGDLHQRGGRFEEMGEASLSIGRNTSVIAIIPLRYTNNSVNARLVFERAGPHSRITEFAILPYSEPNPDTLWRDPDAPPPGAKPLPSPPYANSLLFNIEKVEIAREGMEPFVATLYVPTIATASSPVPAVIFITTSSPTGQPPMVGSSNPTRDIAEGLATKGMAVMVLVPDAWVPTSAEQAADNEEFQAKAKEELDKNIFRNSLPERAASLIASRPELDKTRITLICSAGSGASFSHSLPSTIWIERETGVKFLGVVVYAASSLPTRDSDFLSSSMTFTDAPIVIFYSGSSDDYLDDPNVADAWKERTYPYPNTGPYLVEKIEDGDVTRYGHVLRAVVDDLALFTRTGRLLGPSLPLPGSTSSSSNDVPYHILFQAGAKNP